MKDDTSAKTMSVHADMGSIVSGSDARSEGAAEHGGARLARPAATAGHCHGQPPARLGPSACKGAVPLASARLHAVRALSVVRIISPLCVGF